MKNLILILSLCFVLFSCFEKEEEVTVVPEEEIAVVPIEEGNVMECEMVIKFIEEINNCPVPREGDGRASINKYNYKGKMTYYINPTGSCWTDDLGFIIDGNCNKVCITSHVYEEDTCSDWSQNAVFVETVWRDNR
ncbi:MAG: hypothetical protein COZ18_00085 [Flexibacter sp. CG_4_10_14_3_um_filter_32_15]|nr:MAG: hypothetical protein COZ18_00085 [Flexibacter sp. CG_4_10_14_3_um_filter_32_15]